MKEDKSKTKFVNKIKNKKNFGIFFVLFFLLLILIIIIPTDSLNTYNFKNDYSANKNSNQVIGFLNLDKNTNTIKTENRNIEDLKRDEENNSEKEENLKYDPAVFLGSFGYSKSNFDNEKSNLRIDSVSTGISFYPDVEVNEIDKDKLSNETEKKMSNFSCNNFKDSQKDVKCILSNCLELENKKLFYNGEQISLPEDLTNIEAITLSILDNSFVVSFTLKKNKKYTADVYLYNGTNFSKLNIIPEINTDKFGLVGIGGTLNDFIFVYGSSKGISYHIQDGDVKNISKFFDYRVMKQGLKVEIIRVDDNKRIDWYIYSSTCNKPLFLKLWESEKREIIGEIFLLDQIPFIGKEFSVNLESFSSSYRKFNLYYKGVRDDKYYNFFDYGFKNEETGYLYSKKMDFSNDKHVNLEQIIIAGVKNNNEDDYTFEISIDDDSYNNVKSDNEGKFKNNNVNSYVLKLKTKKEEDKFYSPFFQNLSFDYAYSKL